MFCSLFNDAFFSDSNYTALNNRGDRWMSWKWYKKKWSPPNFKALFQQLPEGTEKNHKNPESGKLVCGPKFESDTSRMRSSRPRRSVTALGYEHRKINTIRSETPENLWFIPSEVQWQSFQEKNYTYKFYSSSNNSLLQIELHILPQCFFEEHFMNPNRFRTGYVPPFFFVQFQSNIC
jgi:hypothetical protein